MTASAPSPVVQLRAVFKTYPGAVPVAALKPTDLVVAQGDYVTITGSSGSGKSTLLNILGLLDEPTGGEMELAGRPLAGAPDSFRSAARSQWFGFVFQSFHLQAGRTAQENVELGMFYGPLSAADRRERARRTLVELGLGHRLDADPRNLSGGEKQRVAIARAVAHSPAVVFCDEPTGNLDAENTATVLGVLDLLHASGITVVVVTHEEEVARRGDRLLHVSDGVVTEVPRP